jgi:chemotaxis regulatin CheY-phosphate phosphatase CheZ
MIYLLKEETHSEPAVMTQTLLMEVCLIQAFVDLNGQIVVNFDVLIQLF